MHVTKMIMGVIGMVYATALTWGVVTLLTFDNKADPDEETFIGKYHTADQNE